jgi:AcrR family transcriptional regulator
MTENPGKREQLREERRRQILEAALTVFSQKGFSAANVSDVAARAGVSQGTIYWYFDSKEELLTAALLSFFEDFGQETYAALEGCTTTADMMRALARSMAGFGEAAGSLFMLFLEFWASSGRREESAKLWIDLLVEYKDVLVGLIDEGARTGEFKPVEAEPLVWAMLAAYDGLAGYVMLMPDLDLGQISQVFVETLLSGLLIREGGEAGAGPEPESPAGGGGR